MTHKTLLVHPGSIEAVETYHNDDNEVTSIVVHTTGGGKFSSSSHQYCDPALTDGMLALRGEELDQYEEDQENE